MAQLPPPGGSPNPYAELLYAALAAHGMPRAPFGGLSLGALWRSRRTVAFLHFHWRPDRWYAPSLDRPGALGRARRVRAGAELCRFALHLACARLLGYRIVWTVHEVRPPRHARIDRAGLALLARASCALLAHNRAVADQLRQELGRPLAIEVVPHGTFRGVYLPARSADELRAELGIRAGAFVFLCFGQLRADKDVSLLLDGFAAAGLPDAYLVIAGAPADGPSRRRVQQAAEADGRICAMLELVPHERVAELFGIADAFVLARSTVWTSGSLVLALSLGVPAVAARLPPVLELLGDGEAGWLFAPGDVESLTGALRAAALDRAAGADKRRAALRRGAELPSWEDVACGTTRLLARDAR